MMQLDKKVMQQMEWMINAKSHSLDSMRENDLSLKEIAFLFNAQTYFLAGMTTFHHTLHVKVSCEKTLWEKYKTFQVQRMSFSGTLQR